MQIRVHIATQTLELFAPSGALARRYVVSTSKFGTGCEPGSQKTPTGAFLIESKWGDGAPEGEVFVSRVATGTFGKEEDPTDHVQTRILWLTGLSEENANTYSRYIYIHGTNAESLLGSPASHGCVRMSNADVIDLFDRVEVGTPVWILDEETH
jgi:lipoprotein-anchoring transpeptidase ErfK/SrfK